MNFRFDKDTGLCMKGDNQRFTTVRFDSLPSVKKFGMFTGSMVRYDCCDLMCQLVLLLVIS